MNEFRYLEPEYADAFKSWKASPNPQTSDQLLKVVQPAISRGIQAHAAGSDGPLIRSRAKLLALQSLNTYDPERSGIGTHLYNNLQGLRRINRQQTQPVHLPERMSLEQGALYDAETELTDKLGRAPSDGELADHTGLSRKRIAKIRSGGAVVSEGMFSGEGGPILPTGVQSRHDLMFDLIYHDLDGINQAIVDHTIGRNGRQVLSNQELAAKLRITPGAVSQRKAAIQKKLDEMEDLRVL